MTCAACTPPEPRLLGSLITELQEIERKTLIQEITANFEIPVNIAFSFNRHEAQISTLDVNRGVVSAPWPLDYDIAERKRVIDWLVSIKPHPAESYHRTTTPDVYSAVACHVGINQHGQDHMRKQIERVAQLFWTSWHLRDPKTPEKSPVFTFWPGFMEKTLFTPKQEQLLEAAHSLVGMNQLL